MPGIYWRIAQNDPAAAERWLAAVENTFDQIARFPDCGVVYRTRRRKLSRVRMLPVNGFADYLVFYCVEPTGARVLYVVHGARHLLRLFRVDPRT